MNPIDIEFGFKNETFTYIDRYAVYGLLIEDQNILVVRTPRGYFLPGGGIQSNETHSECLQREMLEETGYDVEIISYVGTSVLHDKSPKDDRYYNMYGSFYLIVKTDEKEKVEIDHQSEFMPLDEAIQKLKLIHQVWAIKKIYDRISEPVIT